MSGIKHLARRTMLAVAPTTSIDIGLQSVTTRPTGSVRVRVRLLLGLTDKDVASQERTHTVRFVR